MMYRCTLVILALLVGCQKELPDQDSAPMEDTNSSDFWGHRFLTQANISYSEENHELQKLDVFIQGQWVGEPDLFKPDSIKSPILFFIHGGSWLFVDKTERIGHVLPYLQRGWNVVNVNYRVGEGTAPQAVDDVLCALRWVNDNAYKYNGDISNVVISGESAGGHLALIAGLLHGKQKERKCSIPDSLNVKAIVNWFGVTDIEKLEQHFSVTWPDINIVQMWVGDEEKVKDISDRYSPIHHLHPGIPPILTIHGDKDTVVPYDQASVFHDSLNALGLKNELLTLEDGSHVGFTDQQWQEAYNTIFDFLGDL